MVEDSHVDMPVDGRPFEEIFDHDVQPFARLIRAGLGGIMPAHVIYSAVDDKPACFSAFWLQEVLRTRLAYSGVVFSDDLTMRGAHVMGDIVERALAALSAGCDMVLVCNHAEETAKLLDRLRVESNPVSQLRLARMHEQHNLDRRSLMQDPAWREAVTMLDELRGHGTLELEV